jgi:phosphate-selective porin OprO and OprP
MASRDSIRHRTAFDSKDVRCSASTAATFTAAVWLSYCAGAICSSQETSSSGWVSAVWPDQAASIGPFNDNLPPNTEELKPSGTLRHIAFQLRGRIDTDAIGTAQSAANEATFGELGNVVGLRRAWIGSEGSFESARYAAIIDLASGNVVIRDLFVGLGDIEQEGEVRAGHYLEPFSLEVATFSTALPFLETSAVSILDPARNWGLGLFRAAFGDTGRVAAAIFQAGTDANDFRGGEGSTLGLTGKWFAAPINADDGQRLVHLGVALSERLPEDGFIIINQRTQSSLLGLSDVSSSPFLSEIRIPASFQQLANLQVAVCNGIFWSQAEWYGSWIDQLGGQPVFFHGCHADCGVFLTGEHRNYLSTTGAFGPIKVDRPILRLPRDLDRPLGWGAWELTARIAYVDFQDSDTPGGAANQAVGLGLVEPTFGVNWYLADQVRLLFNYSYVVLDEPNTGRSASNVFAGRLGVFW